MELLQRLQLLVFVVMYHYTQLLGTTKQKMITNLAIFVRAQAASN